MFKVSSADLQALRQPRSRTSTALLLGCCNLNALRYDDNCSDKNQQINSVDVFKYIGRKIMSHGRHEYVEMASAFS